MPRFDSGGVVWAANSVYDHYGHTGPRIQFSDPHGNYTAYEPTEKIGDLP